MQRAAVLFYVHSHIKLTSSPPDYYVAGNNSQNNSTSVFDLLNTGIRVFTN